MKNIIVLLTDTFRYDNLGNQAEQPLFVRQKLTRSPPNVLLRWKSSI